MLHLGSVISDWVYTDLSDLVSSVKRICVLVFVVYMREMWSSKRDAKKNPVCVKTARLSSAGPCGCQENKTWSSPVCTVYQSLSEGWVSPCVFSNVIGKKLIFFFLIHFSAVAQENILLYHSIYWLEIKWPSQITVWKLFLMQCIHNTDKFTCDELSVIHVSRFSVFNRVF